MDVYWSKPRQILANEDSFAQSPARPQAEFLQVRACESKYDQTLLLGLVNVKGSQVQILSARPLSARPNNRL